MKVALWSKQYLERVTHAKSPSLAISSSLSSGVSWGFVWLTKPQDEMSRTSLSGRRLKGKRQGISGEWEAISRPNSLPIPFERMPRS